jgi:outer membrane protein assembly factor BamB
LKIKILLVLNIVILVSHPFSGLSFSEYSHAGTTIYEPELAYEGYTIYLRKEENRALMINMEGLLIHEWKPLDNELSYGYFVGPLSNSNLLVSGNPLRSGSLKNSSSELPYIQDFLLELDWESNVVWQYSDAGALHHDFERLENGNTLILCTEERVVPEISPRPILDDYIVEVDPKGSIVWKWHTYEHFDELGFSDETKEQIAEVGGDWAHTNSLQSLPRNSLRDPRFEEGNILVSQRDTDIIFILDKRTGQIVWRVGPSDNLTIGQHSPKMIPEGLESAGNILVFDNGGSACYSPEVRNYSRVIEIVPGSKKIVWKYDALESGLPLSTFFSRYWGSAQRLPNGNTLINEGSKGRLFEITPSGEIVWEYYHSFSNGTDDGVKVIYNAWRVNLDWPAFASSSGEGGGCFMATAAYGTPMEPHVSNLRNFRDTYLLPCKLGRMLVYTYYRYSPPIADFIASYEILKKVVRICLLPFVVLSYSTLHLGLTITRTGLVLIFVLPIFLISVYRKRVWG